MKYTAILIALVLHAFNCIVCAASDCAAPSLIQIHIGQDIDHGVSLEFNSQPLSRDSLDKEMLRIASIGTNEFIDVMVNTNTPISDFFSFISSLTSKGFSSIRVWSIGGDTSLTGSQDIHYIFNSIPTQRIDVYHNENPVNDVEIKIPEVE